MSLISIVFYNIPDLTLFIRVVRRADQAVLNILTSSFDSSPSAMEWSDTIISVEENTIISRGLYSADVIFPEGTHVCDVLILESSAEDTIPLEGFEFIADGASSSEITLNTVKLNSDGLDVISVTEPSGRASNFREIIVQLYMRFFNKVDKTSTQIRVYDGDGVVSTIQEHTTVKNITTVNKTS